MNELDRDDWQRFCQGDKTGMARIYSRHKNKLYTFCMYVTGNRQLSEDVVQETFIRLMGQSQKLGRNVRIKDWLFICARNLTYNQLKRHQLSSSLSDVVDPPTESNIETRIFIQDILGKLDFDERELILLREQQRFTTEEISFMLGISEEAVRVRLYRIRKKMQQIAKEAK
jgi:RNA polymerase sigma-70 factor (ECF subfamily)